MPRPYRVMTVCTGNICRSPMAEVVLRRAFDDAGLRQVEVDSTGISDEEHGNPIDPRAARALAAHGYEVPAHRARRVSPDQLADRDLVLAMTAQHAHVLRRLGGQPVLYRAFDPAVRSGTPEHRLDVDDPWYGDEAGFERTLAELEAAAAAIVAHVRDELG